MRLMIERTTLFKLTNTTKRSIVSSIELLPTTEHDDIIAPLKEEFEAFRTGHAILVSPDLKSGEVMVIEDDSTRFSWVLHLDNDGELKLFSQVNPDVFTDTVLQIREWESQAIGKEMLESDEVYQMLKNAPTVDEYKKKHHVTTSKGSSYVIA